MSRYRLIPTPEQDHALRVHCAQAVQLTQARAEFRWLAAGSQMVQQQALRDFAQAMSNFYSGTHGKPTWRKAGQHEAFRIVAVKPGHIRRLSRKIGEVWVPKAGWVRFRWSRAVPTANSYRVTCNRAGRWHIAFATIPQPIPPPGTGEIVGVDRGVAVSAALSTGQLLHCPGLHPAEQARLRLLQRKLTRAQKGSRRRARVKGSIARLKAREGDRRKDWVEQTSTSLARRFDIIRIEDLRITSMTRSARGSLERPGRNVRQKAGLNRGILKSGWGLLGRRLQDKARGRVEKIPPAFTSQLCSACGHVAADSRESQALFSCSVCKYTGHADVNAARNIAAGHAVTARGRSPLGGRTNREPQPLLLSSA